MGGPGYLFADEFVPELTFNRRGLLAMANSGAATNGSQFFITFAPAEHLNGLHTIFGEVIEGEEVLDEIRRRDPASDPNEGDKIVRVIVLESE
jgi:cyclophilin family peptidyl-prolyl cis-trans isomerase